MNCNKCVTDGRLWAELVNRTSVCVTRLSSIGSKVVNVVSKISGCEPIVKSTKNYWLEIGLPVGLICLGIIIFLIWWWIQRRGSGEYDGLLEDAVNDDGSEVVHVEPQQQQQQPPLPPLPTLTPAPGVVV